MKLLVLLMSVGIWLSVVKAGNVCPDDPKGGYKPWFPAKGCDLCEEMFKDDSDFMNKCGSKISAYYLKKVKEQCEAAKNDDKQFQQFILKKRYFCKEYGHDMFEFPMCGCHPCVKLQKLSGDFWTKCVPKLNDRVVNNFIYSCYNVLDDSEKLWDLWRKIDSMCYYVTYERIKLPMCRCDVCWLLMEWDSDFMQNCGKHLTPEQRYTILYDCEKVKCDPQKLWYFKELLNERCVKYGYTKFEFEECDCNECWTLLDEESDFMKNCGKHLSKDEQTDIIHKCFNKHKDMHKLWAYFQHLENHCYCTYENYFSIPMCDCEPCWLLKDPSTDFNRKCYKNLPCDKQKDLIAHCLKVWKDPVRYEKFVDYAKGVCKSHACEVDLPSCLDCACVKVDLIFVVDTSGSLRGFEDQQKQFLTNVCNALTIGPDCTRVGLVQFTGVPSLKLSLSDGDDKGEISTKINELPDTASGGTNIGAGLTRMLQEFSNARSGAALVGVLITDGQDSSVLPNLNVAGLTMIAVGVGNINQLQLEAIATGNGDDNVIKVADFDELLTKVPELVEEICTAA